MLDWLARWVCICVLLVKSEFVSSELHHGWDAARRSTFHGRKPSLSNQTHHGVRLQSGTLWFSLDSWHGPHAFEMDERFASLEARHQSSAFFSPKGPVVEAPSQWLVHVQPPITTEKAYRLQRDLSVRGYRLGDYVPKHAYVVSLLEEKDAAQVRNELAEMNSVRAATPMEPHFKVCKTLWTEMMSKVGGCDPPLTRQLRIISVAEDPSASRRLLRKCMARAREESGWSCALASQGVVIVALANLHIEEMLDSVVWFAGLPETHYVGQRPHHVLFNKYAKFILQSGKKEDSVPIWHQKITGKGQVVAVGDTGVDVDHCYFRDEKFGTPYNTVNMKHRKVVYYDAYGDRKDELGGHGTHVAGSIAGAVVESMAKAGDSYDFLREYNGMAPDSKLAIFDFSVAPELNVPDDLDRDYLMRAYNRTGARISSNSWGSEGALYDLESLQVDRFVWEHRDMLILFAAGNSGESGETSLSSPSVAKNVVAVGASKSTSDSFSEYEVELGLEIHAPTDAAGVIEAIPGLFGKHYGAMDPSVGPLKAVWANPRNGCMKLHNARELTGNVVVVERGNCTFVSKARAVGSTNAVFMIVVNNVRGPPIPMSGEKGSNRTTDGLLASIMVSSKFANIMDNANADDAVVTVSGPSEYHTPDLKQDRLAPFSSRGPTLDGRLKPDVVSPGMFIVSAGSDGSKGSNQCHKRDGVVTMQGTSMATPITAGGAALLRQYFVDGFYPSGSANPDDSLQPSAALLKAMLISSTIPLRGTVPVPFDGEELSRAIHSPMHGFDQGYGRVELDNAMHFANVSFHEHSHVHKAPNLFVVDYDDVPLAEGVVKSFCFSARSDDAEDEDIFRASLVWTDPPGSALSWYQLVNDLDLFVMDETTDKVYMGNSGLNTYLDTSYLVWDALNNNEKVSLSRFTSAGKDAHRFSVHVHAVTTIGDSANNFALVVNGKFEALDLSECEFDGANREAFEWALNSTGERRARLLWLWPVVIFVLLLTCILIAAGTLAYYRQRRREGASFSAFRFFGVGSEGHERVAVAEDFEAPREAHI